MKKYIISLLVIALSLLVSCQKDSSDTEQRVEIPTLATQGLTTVGWVDGAQVGVYVVETGGSFASDLINGADNREFVYNAGKLAPKDATQKIVVNNIVKFDVVAYAPHKATGVAAGQINGFKYPVDISDQSTIKAIDLLYSNNMKKMSSEMGSSLMRFDHALSRLNIRVKSSLLTPAQMRGLTVELVNTQVKAEFNLQTGVFDTQSPDNGSTQASRVVDGSVYEALMIPINLGTAYFKVATVANGEFQFNVSDWSAMESGKSFDVTLNLDRGGDVEIVENVINSWAPWSEGNLIDMTDKFTDVVFKEWVVRNICNVPVSVPLADARIMLGDVNKVKSIKIDGSTWVAPAGFSTFAGLEYFSELQHLYIGEVPIQEDSLNLRLLPSSIQKRGASVTVFDIPDLTKIISVEAYSVAIENNMSLKEIDFSTSGSSIRNLRVVGNGGLSQYLLLETWACYSLETLVCMSNPTLENINISASTKIKALQLDDNNEVVGSDIFYVDLWDGINIYDLPAMFPFFSHYDGDTWTTVNGYKVTVEYFSNTP